MTDDVSQQRWVGTNEASSAWADAAREVLVEVAGHYPGLITYADLAEQVQVRTGLRTRSPFRSWIGGVLATVVARVRADGLPPLTSLVVNRTDGEAQTEEAVAHARLTCYRRYADDIPAEVIAAADAEARAKEVQAQEAARARSVRPSRPRTPRAPRERAQPTPEAAPKICPTCFVQLPASGICDECG
ncbi:hypothetical protein EXU48_02775 [Occultella glacieicola]|uniref:Uncharacterized protein n=1 Tax=Occultella glacieicola TaxID=2518684 RepID=A0ABY2EBG5_9MICO|nr:hypothetical protein [Occultella glacieicola]TDE99118.1 hypothetical protein EXU48_02775 [Occultella glacieicola]